MALRVCLVTPFASSQPHPVNDHVRGAAAALERRGHEVVVLAPSNRAAELAAGRRALRALVRDRAPLPPLVALGPAVPVTPRSRIGVPLGVRANLSLALTVDRFDVVHAHEPGVPSLSFLALRQARGLTVATFHSAERLAYPPSRTQRERLLARIDALTATDDRALAAARERFPGDYVRIPLGVDEELFRPAAAERRFVLEWRPDEAVRVAAVLRALADLPDWELTVLRTRALTGRPYLPRALRGRVRVRAGLDAGSRARELRGAAGFIPALRGSRRPRVEAALAGVPAVEPPGARDQPALLAAALARLADDEHWREEQARAGREAALGETFSALADVLERDVYRRVVARRRSATGGANPLAGRPEIVCDLHMHTEHSHDCSVSVADLLAQAEAVGLAAVAITDHNTFAGAREALELARGRSIRVIPGEEIKTTAGEVIGLFLREGIPRGLSMGDTIAAIREQGGVVYLPHPFDRLHAIPDAQTLHAHLAEIDVFEVYNAKLLREAFNDEALRFARKYNLTMGAGSDAHVLQAVGTGAVRMRAFETPEEFLIAMRTAEILRRPKSLVYLQGLKWTAGIRARGRESLAKMTSASS
jgi:predicted metal-dependent phosphoesterase TrpH